MAVINDQDLAKSQVVIDRLKRIGRGIEDSVKVIALWLWLESAWNLEFIAVDISTSDDESFKLLSNEAVAVFSSVMRLSNVPIPPFLLGQTLSLPKRLVSFSSIFSNRDLVFKGLSDIYTELCRAHNVETPNCGLKPKLNPSAKAWNPTNDRASEDDRCLFLTFSKGHPLNETQIFRFFVREYGDCVERVYVNWPNKVEGNRQAAPLFGKVVFNCCCIPALILRGQIKAKFWIDNRPMWCKKFDKDKRNRKDA